MVKTFCAVQSGPGHRGIFFIISMPVCYSDIKGQSCISWWTEKFGQINHVTLSVYFFVCVCIRYTSIGVFLCCLLCVACSQLQVTLCVCVCILFVCVCVCVLFVCVCVHFSLFCLCVIVCALLAHSGRWRCRKSSFCLLHGPGARLLGNVCVCAFTDACLSMCSRFFSCLEEKSRFIQLYSQLKLCLLLSQRLSRHSFSVGEFRHRLLHSRRLCLHFRQDLLAQR